MDKMNTLPEFIKRSGRRPRYRSTVVPKWHFLILAGLILIICLGAVLYSMPAQLIGLIAFFALYLCYFVDAACFQRSDRRLKAIIQASPNPIIVYNKQGHPQILNRVFTQIFGWTLDELSGRRIPFVPEAEIPITARKIKEIFQTGLPVSFETRRMTKAGDIRDVIVSAAIAMGRDRTPAEMVVNITDITERKQFEARLQQAQKMEAMGTLAGGIAHDFNNILSPMIGYSEMLMDEIPADSPMQEDLVEILTAGRRAKELVNQILAFSRKSDAKPEATKLQPFISETLKLIRSSLPSTIRIEQKIDADCGPVMANPTQIHQVVMNLATNAYHAMKDTGGKLGITLEEVDLKDDLTRSTGLAPGKYAHLIVNDTGTGIEKQNMAKIFDPYFTTKDQNIGTGLGLSTVQGIIVRLGGNIQVFSEPGRGSEFHIYLPLTGREKKVQKIKSQKPIPGGNEKILLVDDEAVILKMMRRMLERLGYQVDTYTSGIEALTVFRNDPGRFDLVLTDMTMPEMTGDLLTKEVLAIRPSIPVFIHTGYNNSLTSEAVRTMGIKGVLIKPASEEKLAAAVRKALDDARP